MEIGIVFSQADSGSDPAAIRSWAVDAEAAGFAHLMAYDHVLGASSERLGPGPFGSFPHAPYTNEHTFHEILVLFSHLAAITSTMRFVTSVLVSPQRQATLIAKQLATLDLLSGGRVDLALGVGWNAAEYEAMGVNPKDRLPILAEQIEVMRRLWTEPLVTYSGRFHQLDRVGLTPLPGKALPIYLGSGAGDAALKRVVALADGWMPLIIPGLDPIDVATGTRRLRQLCEDAGRDPATMAIHGRVYLGPGWQAKLEEAMALGFDKCSIGFNRLAEPGAPHSRHLEAVVAAKAEIDRILA